MRIFYIFIYYTNIQSIAFFGTLLASILVETQLKKIITNKNIKL